MYKTIAYTSKQDPFIFYTQHKAKYSCFLPREDFILIGLEVAEFYYDMPSLDKAMLEHEEDFFAGYFAYEALQGMTPLNFALKPSLYPHHDILWMRYKKCLRISKRDAAYVYEEFESTGTTQIYMAPADTFVLTKDISMEKEVYIQNAENVISDIAKGSFYQINYSFPLVRKTRGRSTWDLFQSYYAQNPANDFAYFDLDDVQILSFSPERFFQLKDNKITVKPIKGTMPVSEDVERLLNSKKDAAELNMISDLFRNDLYKICKTESVRLRRDKDILKLKHIYHLYSVIEGELAKKFNLTEVMSALFPSGSITGCPKIRSQEEINKLETCKRGIYTGSIGYKFQDDLNLNVAIRTAVTYQEKIIYHVGSGLVFDSEVEQEWQECLLKAKSFLEELS